MGAVATSSANASPASGRPVARKPHRQANAAPSVSEIALHKPAYWKCWGSHAAKGFSRRARSGIESVYTTLLPMASP
jgi:hypothetical protein